MDTIEALAQGLASRNGLEWSYLCEYDRQDYRDEAMMILDCPARDVLASDLATSDGLDLCMLSTADQQAYFDRAVRALQLYYPKPRI